MKGQTQIKGHLDLNFSHLKSYILSAISRTGASFHVLFRWRTSVVGVLGRNCLAQFTARISIGKTKMSLKEGHLERDSEHTVQQTVYKSRPFVVVHVCDYKKR